MKRRWVASALEVPEVMQTIELGPPGPILCSPLWLRLPIGHGAASQAAADRLLAMAWRGLKAERSSPRPKQAQSHGSLLRSSPVARAAS